MKRNKKRIIAAVAVIGALAAGGAAFTASIGNVPATQVAGFAQTSITGATASNVHYVLSDDGQYVDAVNLQFSSPNLAALTADTIKAGFGDTATDATLVACGSPAADGTVPADTDVTCTFTTGGDPTTGVPVDNANYFDASITDSGSGYGS
jgi:hypothetical protein